MIRSLDLLESGIENVIELFPFKLFCFSESRIVHLLPEVTIIKANTHAFKDWKRKCFERSFEVPILLELKKKGEINIMKTIFTQ